MVYCFKSLNIQSVIDLNGRRWILLAMACPVVHQDAPKFEQVPRGIGDCHLIADQVRRRQGMKPPRERGRPARTSLPAASFISSTWLDRQRRQDSTSAEHMPYLPAGWPGAASQGNSAEPNGSACGRDARAPGGFHPVVRLGEYPSGDFSESRQAPFGKLPFARVHAPRPSPEKILCILCIDVNKNFGPACL